MSDWSFWTSYFPDSQPKAQDVEGQGLACWMISFDRVQSSELRARMWDIKCKVRIRRPRPRAAGATRRWWVWGKLAPWRKRVDIIQHEEHDLLKSSLINLTSTDIRRRWRPRRTLWRWTFPVSGRRNRGSRTAAGGSGSSSQGVKYKKCQILTNIKYQQISSGSSSQGFKYQQISNINKYQY